MQNPRAGSDRILTRSIAMAAAIILISSFCLPISANSRAALFRQSQTEDLKEATRLRAEVEKLFASGRYNEAIPLAEQLQVILEKVFGPDHAEAISFLNNLALIYYSVGDYGKAEPLFHRVLSAREKALGPEHPSLLSPLNNLSLLYHAKGDYGKAEPMAARALAIREKYFGPDNPDVATSLDNLGLILGANGDTEKAEKLHERALAILEKHLGPDHLLVALSVNNLAGLYYGRGIYDRAELLFERALGIRERALGPDHPAVAMSLSNLGVVCEAAGKYEKAERLYERAIEIHAKLPGPEHYELGLATANLGWLYFRRGNYEEAERLLERTSALWEETLGPDHPSLALPLANISSLHEAKGDVSKAISCRTRGNDISERHIALNLAAGSEQQKLQFLAIYSAETDRTISLHARSAPNDPAALRLSLTTILRRKGRALDAMADSLAALRQRLDDRDRELLDQLTETRSRLATLMLGGATGGSPADRRAEIERLEKRQEELEKEASRRSAEFRVASRPVTLEAVQSLIPSDAILIEFVAYRPFNAKYKGYDDRFGKARYIAYALRNQGAPAWVDLGDAEVIDKRIEAWREALRDPDRKDVKRLAREVDKVTMRPVRRLLGETQKILLSPDGALNLIPFGALVDEKDRYMVERYSITYLTTGRDLLRLQESAPSKQAAVIIANPDFGGEETPAEDRELKVKKGESNSPKTDSQTAIDFSEAYFKPLPGTAEEAEALKEILPGATVLTKKEATEKAIKQVAGPRILHVATHGFFLDSVETKLSPATRQLFIARPSSEPVATSIRVVNPLLRSGLGLAGANLRGGEGENGVLTAHEASVLNLWGTKLVVLSACDTGVGEVRNGDGVFGLRRALVLAGSESQVMSLWSVSDEGTRDLMIEYYKSLKSGKGRSEALRDVQLRMLAGKKRRHPYYWASFIQSGEWANLDGKR